MADILIGKGEKPVQLLAKYGNRHGLVAGATGTGKTITLEVLAEGFSRIGVPVFIGDVKGDVSGVAMAGTMTDKLKERRCPNWRREFRDRSQPDDILGFIWQSGTPRAGDD